MVHRSRRLDMSFGALSDTTRRDVLMQLGRAGASISDLAEKFHMTLTGMKKHIAVLERAGLVKTAKKGRVRTCTLGRQGLEDVTLWMRSYQKMWDARFDTHTDTTEAIVKKWKQREIQK